jgi:hypothetical protein
MVPIKRALAFYCGIPRMVVADKFITRKPFTGNNVLEEHEVGIKDTKATF